MLNEKSVQRTNFTCFHAGPKEGWTEFRLEPPDVPVPARGKLFLRSLLASAGLEMSLNVVPPGKGMPFLHRHRDNDEVYIVVGGRGQFLVDGECIDVEEGSVLRLPMPAWNMTCGSATASGNLRQIDVAIQGTFAGWPMLGVIECKDQSRKKGIEDVDAFVTKTQHLGAGLRLMVSKKGFTKPGLRLAAHEHIQCLSLLPNASHEFGFEIGEWWYGIVSRWTDFMLTVSFADETQKNDRWLAEDVLYQGKPVINWFHKEFYTTYRDRTIFGGSRIDVPFDEVTNLEIHGKEYPVTGLSCSAKGVFLKKRKWVTYSGRAFYNWHTGKITIPPGVQVHTQPVITDLLSWEDYDGDIRPPEDPTDRILSRGVFVFTQYFDQSLPVPDLEVLSPGERTDERPPAPLKPGVFDANHEMIRRAIEQAGKSTPPPAT